MGKSKFVSPNGYQWAEEVRIPKAGGGTQKAYVVADNGSELIVEWTDLDAVHRDALMKSSVRDHFTLGDRVQFNRNGSIQYGKVDKVEGGKVFISGENQGQSFKVKLDAELAAKPRVKNSGPRPASAHANDVSDPDSVEDVTNPDPPSPTEIADQSRKVAKLERDIETFGNEIQTAERAYAKFAPESDKAKSIKSTIDARKDQLEALKKELQIESNFLKSMSQH